MAAPVEQLDTSESRGRQCRCLATFLHRAEMDALLGQLPVTLADRRPLAVVMSEAHQRAASLPYVSAEVGPLPEEMEAAAREVRGREVFRPEYEAKAAVSSTGRALPAGEESSS